MAKLSIDNISKNIFRTAPAKTESNHSNPFGVSFKGNVLTADVFQSVKKTNLISKAKNKLMTSTFVGSINDFSSAMSARLNTIADFGRTMKSNVVGAWKKAQSINITGEAIKEYLNKPLFVNQYSPRNLDKLSISARRSMLEELLPNLATA